MTHYNSGTMLSACVEWLNDWTQTIETPIVDEYDLTAWLEAEGCDAIDTFLHLAFRKSKTRGEALEILRAILWEWFACRRDQAIHNLPPPVTGTVERLLGVQQTAQKTPAWYAEARNLLTGHEFAHVVHGTPAAFEGAVARKCCPEAVLDLTADPVESRIVYVTPEGGKLSPFQWGWRYESVIRDLYEQEFALGRVDDSLGRIRHPRLPRLAASPDGLICEGEKVGRLLEIKAPITRELEGVVPAEYYCQMQLQAEVADVEAVEYIEVRFRTMTVEEIPAWTPSTQTPIQRCGAVLVIALTPDAPPEEWIYAYTPIKSCTEAGFAAVQSWLPETMSHDAVVLERSVWVIQALWTTTVHRNRRWWAEVGQPAYERFWTAVDAARLSGKYTSACLIVDEDDDKEDVKKETRSGCLIMESEDEKESEPTS